MVVSVLILALPVAFSNSLMQTWLPLDRYMSYPSPCGEARTCSLVGEEELAEMLVLLLWGEKV